MRPDRTSSEQAAIDALVAAIRSHGTTVEEVPGITDKPEAALVIGGSIVAVECRRFMLQDMMRHYSLTSRIDGTRIAYLPLEPHAWVYKAIQAKNGKIPEYLARTHSNRAWLLLHTEPGAFAELPDIYNDGCEPHFRLGAAIHQHGFERVYLWGPTLHEPICLFSELDSLVERDRLRRNAPRTLTVRKMMLQQLELSTSCVESATYTGIIDSASESVIRLQPLDIRFKINYAPDPIQDGSWLPETVFLGGRLRFRDSSEQA
jgi:hypothetical protein